MNRRNWRDKITNPNFKQNPNQGGYTNPQDIQNPFVKRPKLQTNEPPSNQNVSKTVLLKLKQARTNGTINLANLHLNEIPPEVFDPNVNIPDVNWWEMVDITKLDASNNNLSENSFDDEQKNLALLSYLISLRLSNNNFTYLPNSLYTLSNLKLLDVSGNKITYLNANAIKSLCSLVELDISKNELTSIPEEIQHLTYLEVLNLSTNKLVDLPRGLGFLFRMKKLYIDNNSLQVINPDVFVNMSALEELYIFKNRIESLSKNITSSFLDNLKNLKFLDAHSNYITYIKINYELPQLDSLLLSYNQITKIEGIEKCINLTNLDVNNNKIEQFPKDILSLQKLNTLNIQNNSINELPPTLGLMNSLIRLNIEGNPLKRLVSKMKNANTEQIKKYLKTRITDKDLEETPMKKKDFYDIDTTVSKQNISAFITNTTLNMTKNELNALPIEDFKNYIRKNTLDTIDFSFNKIIDLYPIENILPIIQSLKELNLSNNNIDKFPLCILSLPNLITLNISHNKIAYFPYERFTNDNIKELRCSLVYFDISFNQLTNVPDTIGLYTNLSTFLANNNYITNINNMCNMKLEKLDTINFGNNKIERLPNKLYKSIPNAKVFIFENNNLKDIPTDFCLLFNLNVINFYGNAIKKIRSDLLLNAQGMLAYLKRFHNYDQEDHAYEESKTYKTDINKMVIDDDYSKKPQIRQSMNNSITRPGNSITSTNGTNIQEQIDKINQEIGVIEANLQQPNLAMFKKNDLRKQLHALIRQRANLLK